MRFKWLNVEWPRSIPQLVVQMKSLEFHSGQHHGFVLDKVRENSIEARYVEEINYTDSITDPFGKVTSFDRKEFRESAFKITATSPTLELINAPRSIQALLSRFSEITDFTVSIEQLKVNVMSWAEGVLLTSGLEGSIDMLQISKVELKNKAFAKILVSGDKEIKDTCTELIGNRKHTLEKVRIRLTGQTRGTIILTNNGSATLNLDDISESLTKTLRASINNSLEPKF